MLEPETIESQIAELKARVDALEKHNEAPVPIDAELKARVDAIESDLDKAGVRRLEVVTAEPATEPATAPIGEAAGPDEGAKGAE